MRYSGKFWRENERRKLQRIGLEPIPGSGAGERKEDGEDEYILCQLKSTQGDSIRMDRLDLEKLILHAEQLGKVPLFYLDFLPNTRLFAVLPEDLEFIAEYFATGKMSKEKVESVQLVKEGRRRKRKKVTVRRNTKTIEELRKEERELFESESGPKEDKSLDAISRAIQKRKERDSKRWKS